MIFLPTEHLEVHMNLFKHVGVFQIKLEFGHVGFRGEGKTGAHREKPLGGNSTHMASMPGFETWSHWGEASVLTMAPHMLYE